MPHDALSPDLPERAAHAIHSQRRSFIGIALLVSLLIHLLLGTGWILWEYALAQRLDEVKPPEENVLVADLVSELPPPPPPPPPPPEPPAPTPPPPPPKKREITKPQLQQGDLDERPKAKPEPKAETAKKPERAPKPPSPQGLDKPQSWYDGLQMNQPPAYDPTLDNKLTQNEHDWLLSRILVHWKAPPDLRGSEYEEASVYLTVLPDGTFAPPFNRADPYNPTAVSREYASLPPNGLKRRAIDSFYRAIRASQPLILPKSMIARAPFRIHLVFRIDDVL